MPESIQTYPRVLFLHMTKIYLNDPVNLLVRSFFADWPKENLAQVYSGQYLGKGDYCGSYFELGPQERRFGHLFYFFKPISVNAISGNTTTQKKVGGAVHLVKKFAKTFVSSLTASGRWEEIFRYQISDDLIQFIKNFNPDIIYNQGYSLGFTKLTLEISQRFKIPICYFPVDDWHTSLYEGSRMHQKVELIATEIAQNASMRLALGPKMTDVLTERYQVPFDCVYHADDKTRFIVQSTNASISANRPVTIGYTGSLYLGRISSLVDLVNACNSLDRNILIRIYCPEIPIETPGELINAKQVEFLPLPTHEELPGVLANCDVLFLPESFNPTYEKAISLSLSTKAHLYMMSGRPIIVYAPSYSGIVDYAKRDKWAYVVEERNMDSLVIALRSLIHDNNLKIQLIETAHDVSIKNHDQKKVRQKFLQALQSILNNQNVI